MYRFKRAAAAVIALFALATITTAAALAVPKGTSVLDIPPAVVCSHLAQRNFTLSGTEVSVTPLAHRAQYTIAFVRTTTDDAPVLLRSTSGRCNGTYLYAAGALFDVHDLITLGVPDDVAAALVRQQRATVGPTG